MLRVKDPDIYEGYVEEARAYFEALDYAFESALRIISPVVLPKMFLLTKPSWVERLIRRFV